MTTIPYLEEQLRDTKKDLNYYKNYCERLRNKNKKQKEAIDKAIKYIRIDILDNSENYLRKTGGDVPGSDLPVEYILDLLDILKEVERSVSDE